VVVDVWPTTTWGGRSGSRCRKIPSMWEPERRPSGTSYLPARTSRAR